MSQAFIISCAYAPIISVKAASSSFFNPAKYSSIFLDCKDRGKCSLSFSEEKVCPNIANILYKHGKVLVNKPEDADATLWVYYSCNYGEYYVPQSTYYMPRTIKGGTTYFSGKVGNDYFSGSSQAPDRTEYVPHSRGGYTVGKYYPYVGITLIDNAEGNKIIDIMWERVMSGQVRSEEFLEIFNRASKMWDANAIDTVDDIFPEMFSAIIEALGKKLPWPEVPRGYLGVVVNDLGGGAGVIVNSVFLGTPASKAGIRRGDVITAIGDIPIDNTIIFNQVVLTQTPLSSIKVKLSRGTKQLNLDVIVGSTVSQ